MHETAFRWFTVLKKLKYFEVMLNIFELLQEWENVETWLVNFRRQCVIMMLVGEWEGVLLLMMFWMGSYRISKIINCHLLQNSFSCPQINLIQTLKFMHKTKYGKNPRIFLPKFREVDHQYPTRFSKNSFCYKRSACKTTSFAITVRGPTIWNSFLSPHKKAIPPLSSTNRSWLIAMSDVTL